MRIRTIAQIRGLDISRLRKETIKILNDCGIKKRPNDNLSDIDWVKEFEIMVAGNFKKWKKSYQLALQIKMEKSIERALH
jgi:hypothetical protein